MYNLNLFICQLPQTVQNDIKALLDSYEDINTAEAMNGRINDLINYDTPEAMEISAEIYGIINRR